MSDASQPADHRFNLPRTGLAMSKFPRRANAETKKTIDIGKIGKFLHMLASDKAGEVLASAAALGRVLDAADMDFNDLADAVVAGLKPRKPAVTSWSPPEPDQLYWESMAWFCRYWSRHLRDSDREFVVDALLGNTGFDLRRATPELMRRLRGIVDRVKAARSAEGWR